MVPFLSLKGGCKQKDLFSQNLLFSSYIWTFVREIKKKCFIFNRKKGNKQAGAELGQAQIKLGLHFT